MKSQIFLSKPAVQILSYLIVCQFGVSCASSPVVDDTMATKIDSSSPSALKLTPIAAKEVGGLASYQFDKKSMVVDWSKCIVNATFPYVVFFHGDDQPISTGHFCQEWYAHVLMSNGFNVIAVNRPGFGKSSGKADLGGPRSLAAVAAGVTAALFSASNNSRPAGYWGLDTGTIAASFSAKSNPELQWLLLGSGFYDLDVVLRQSTDASIKKLIQEQKSFEGEIALEHRSILWDPTGLPKLIGLYHARGDMVAPRSQAEAFNSLLRTRQVKVYFDEIEGAGHAIPWQEHYRVVDQELKNLTHH